MDLKLEASNGNWVILQQCFLMKNFELQNAKEIFQEHAWEFYHVGGQDDYAKLDYWL